MNASVQTHQQAGIAVLNVSGDVVLADGTEVLRETVREIILGGTRKVLMNLAGVRNMDSSGIGELLAARTALLNSGGQLKLLRPSKRVVEVLNVARIYSTFEVFQEESSALASFRDGASAEAAKG
jgi:anti-sigma B factor antagonist